MKTARASRRGLWFFMGAIIALVVCALVLTLMPASGPPTKHVVTFPDGSRFALKNVAFEKDYNYQHKSGPNWAVRLAPLIPDPLEYRFFRVFGGGFGFGGTETNLILITEFQAAGTQSDRPFRLRVRDDNGNTFDARWGAHTLGMNRVTVNGWQLPAFPRRTKSLEAEFLGKKSNGEWASLARFPIENPVGLEHPQWTPEPVPQSRTNHDLTARLERFESGVPGVNESPADALAPRLTRLRVSFHEAGREVHRHGIHRLFVSDAAGNRFQPYLSSDSPPGNNWKQAGAAQFLGALWPGEAAWKLELESIQTADHSPDEVWRFGPLPLPRAGAQSHWTNAFRVDATAVQLRQFLAPSVILTNDWQYVIRYWGNEPNVYALGFEFADGKQHREPVVVSAADEAGRDVEVVESRAWDEQRHVLFLKPPTGATALSLELAFPRLKTFEFLARPEFVDNTASVRESSN